MSGLELQIKAWHRSSNLSLKLEKIPGMGPLGASALVAYLKISEGRNHSCTFCTIPPLLRGPLVSQSIGDVLQEAKYLAEAGVREVLVISQDTSTHGVDLKYRTGFYNSRPIKTQLKELCEALAEFAIWVRLHYVYPYPAVDDLLPLMPAGKILHYLDVPSQHANPRILKAMNGLPAPRTTSSVSTPGAQFTPRSRTAAPSLLVPRGTSNEFEELLAFIEEARLDRVGCLAYSTAEGATANDLPGEVPDDVREERRRRLMDAQEDISAEPLAAKIDHEIVMLVDAVDDEGTIARSSADAPEIDGVVSSMISSMPNRRISSSCACSMPMSMTCIQSERKLITGCSEKQQLFRGALARIFRCSAWI